MFAYFVGSLLYGSWEPLDGCKIYVMAPQTIANEGEFMLRTFFISMCVLRCSAFLTLPTNTLTPPERCALQFCTRWRPKPLQIFCLSLCGEKHALPKPPQTEESEPGIEPTGSQLPVQGPAHWANRALPQRSKVQSPRPCAPVHSKGSFSIPNNYFVTILGAYRVF